VAQGGIISPVLFSLNVNDMPSPSHHVELALYADDTVVIATSRQTALLVKYLETYVSALEWWLSKWKIAMNVSKSSAMLFVKNGWRIPQPQPLRFFGEPIKWFDTARYLGVNLDKLFTWSRHIDQVRKKAVQRLGTMGPLLNRRSSLSIRNGVLLYKQLIHLMMDYARPVWRSAARSHIQKLQVLQSKCLRIATNSSWYIDNKQIHDDYFSDHIRHLTGRFNSKLAAVGNSLVARIGRHIRWPRVGLNP
jgi:hypothetical protein